MNVIEAFEGKIDATKDVHGVAGGAGSVTISALNTAVHVPWSKPNVVIQIKDG